MNLFFDFSRRCAGLIDRHWWWMEIVLGLIGWALVIFSYPFVSDLPRYALY